MPISGPPGSDWSPNVLQRIATQYDLDPEDLLEDAFYYTDNGNGYLTEDELTESAKWLTGEDTFTLGVVSDLDKTIIPAHSGSNLPDHSIPGIRQLFEELGTAQTTSYVTARDPSRVTEVPAWLAGHGFPEGPIETGVGTSPWTAQAEKVRDVTAVLERNPDNTYVLFGDSSHRDPEAYREIIEAFPDRIYAAFIHRVNNMSEHRGEGLIPIDNYAEAAGQLLWLGLLDEAAARRVMHSAKDEGLAITNAEINEHIEWFSPE